MSAKTKAYSYVRISSKGQLDGDGLRRQTAKTEQFAAEHNLDLDDELRDVGSGFHGKHVKFGALGEFLKLVESGKIARGSYLLVESLDRLSREDVLSAQIQLLTILKRGIIVVTLIDNMIYTDKSDFQQLIMSLVIMSRANNESAEKSQRAKDRIKRRKLESLDGLPRFNGHLSSWIDQERVPGTRDDYRFSLNHHAASIKRIFEMADSGMGNHSIARALNATNTPVLKPSGRGPAIWRDATIAALLRDETAIGTYTITEKIDDQRVIMGKPLKGYYPAAVDEELFWRVQRKKPQKPTKARPGRNYANLFFRMTACKDCGQVAKCVQGGNAKKRRRYFMCSQRFSTGIVCSENNKAIRYEELEDAVLTYVTDFHSAAASALQVKDYDTAHLTETLENATAVLTDYEQRVESLFDALEYAKTPENRQKLMDRSDDLSRKIEQQKSYIKELTAELAEATNQTSKIASVTEQINLERLTWTTASREEIEKSRSRVARMLREFISLVELDFKNQTTTVYVAGFTSAFKFDNLGHLIAHFDIMPMFRKGIMRHAIHRTPTGRISKIDQITPAPLTSEILEQALKDAGWNSERISMAVRANKLMQAKAFEPVSRVNPRLNDPAVVALKAKRAAAIQR